MKLYAADSLYCHNKKEAHFCPVQKSVIIHEQMTQYTS